MQFVSPPSRRRTNLCYALAFRLIAVLLRCCSSRISKMKTRNTAALRNSTPLSHGYSLLNQSLARPARAIQFHCLSTAFPALLCRRYDYQDGTLPLLCHVNPYNSIAVSTQGSASRFRCCISLHFAALHNSVASRRQPPHRPCVSVRGDSLLCIPLLYLARPYFASPPLRIA